MSRPLQHAEYRDIRASMYVFMNLRSCTEGLRGGCRRTTITTSTREKLVKTS